MVDQTTLECVQQLVRGHYLPGGIAPCYCNMIVYSLAVTQLLTDKGYDLLPQLATDTVGSGFGFLQMLTCLDLGYKVINDSPEHVNYFHGTIAPFLFSLKAVSQWQNCHSLLNPVNDDTLFSAFQMWLLASIEVISSFFFLQLWIYIQLPVY